MAETTENLQLIKPGDDDYYNIEDFNENSDTLDKAYGKVTGEIKDLQSPQYTVATKETELKSGESIVTAFGKIAKAVASFISHIGNAVMHITDSERTYWNNKASKDTATTSANGLMSASDKSKLDGIAAGAQVNSITGVKGNAESTYRTGQVNLTPSNIGASESSHGHSNATASADGFMSKGDKSKLDGVESGAQVNAVTGVKGNSESTYRTGNVNITAANVGAAASSHSHTAASTTADGFMSSADKTKLNGIASGAQVNTVTGIKGNSESTYRTGNVNITAANVGAAASSHSHSDATTSASGYMSASDKSKLNGIASGAQVNSVTGVKGSAEGSYRTGNINLTAANVGAAAASHSHSYLPLSGGTISGGINISNGVSAGGQTDTGIDFNNNDAYFNTFYGPRSAHWTLYGPSGTSNVELTSDNCILLSPNGGGYVATPSYFRPDNTGEYGLGSSSYRWKQLYASTATISTSDRNLKEDIKDVAEKYQKMFLGLRAVTYKLKGNHDRLHVGFIAQEIEAQMDKNGISPLEFGAFCKDQKVDISYSYDETGEKIVTETPVEGEYEYSLRYEEFIALNTKMIQMLYKKVDALEKEVEHLKKKADKKA